MISCQQETYHSICQHWFKSVDLYANVLATGHQLSYYKNYFYQGVS